MLRASGSRAVNYDDAPGAFIVPAVPPSGNPRYFVRSDGVATKAEATDPSSPASAMNEATFNGATFAAGDIVEFDGRGGDLSGVVLQSGGQAGKPVYYVGSRPNPPRIAVGSGSALAIASAISHIRIAHFPDLANTGGDAAVVRIAPGATQVVEDLEMLNVHVTRNRNDAGTLTNHCFHFDNGVTAVLRDISTDSSQAGTGANYCLLAQGKSSIEVHGATFEDGTRGVVATDDAKLYIRDLQSRRINSVSITATGNGVVEIDRSYVEASSGMVDGMVASDNGAGGGYVKLKNCTYVVRAGLDKAPNGTLIFEGCIIDWNSTAARYRVNNSGGHIQVIGGCHLKLGECHFQFIGESGGNGGDVTVTDSLLECVGSFTGDRVLTFRGDGGAKIVRGNVFKEGRLKAACISLQSASNSTILIEGNTFWNSTAGANSRVIENETTGGTPTVFRNNGAENFSTSFDSSDSNIDASFNGWFNAGTAHGSGSVTGDPKMIDPDSNDFRLPDIGSAWKSAGSDGCDIGAGLTFT